MSALGDKIDALTEWWHAWNPFDTPPWEPDLADDPDAAIRWLFETWQPVCAALSSKVAETPHMETWRSMLSGGEWTVAGVEGEWLFAETFDRSWTYNQLFALWQCYDLGRRLGLIKEPLSYDPYVPPAWPDPSMPKVVPAPNGGPIAPDDPPLREVGGGATSKPFPWAAVIGLGSMVGAAMVLE